MKVNELLINKNFDGLIEFELGGEKLDLALNVNQTFILRQFFLKHCDKISIDTLAEHKATVIKFIK